jgi:hypothetical protein
MNYGVKFGTRTECAGDSLGADSNHSISDAFGAAQASWPEIDQSRTDKNSHAVLSLARRSHALTFTGRTAEKRERAHWPTVISSDITFFLQILPALKITMGD